jgi:pyrimidine operon attenuation protein/uracil phosphoribosyltransferase
MANHDKIVMTPDAMASQLIHLAEAILNAHRSAEDIYLLGIISRGKPLADRLAQIIQEKTGVQPHVGALSTTLYRDDIRSGKVTVKLGSDNTHFDFDVTDKSVVLVDDVLYSGRTIRAALDEVMDYGRPARIQLACLIDRGQRELPIQADYLGMSVQTQPNDHIQVLLNEIDGEDSVVLRSSSEEST